MNPILWGVVLVGGRSSRMGRDKAALPHPAGGTFLDHAIGRLRELGCPVLLSGAAAVPTRWADQPLVSAIPDPLVDAGRNYAGPVVGLVAALQFSAAAGANGILVTPVDMPCLTSDDLRGLLANFTDSPSCGESASGEFFSRESVSSEPVIGTFDEAHREPLVAVYPLAVLESLEQLAAGGDRSLNRWLATHPHRLHPLPAEAAANVNTPAEYDRAIGSTTPRAPHREKP